MTSRTRRSSITTMALWIGVALVAAACSDSDSSDSSGSSDSSDSSPPSSDAAVEPFSFSVSIGEPASIDPAMASEVEGGQVIRLLFQPLVTLTPDLQVAPGAATEWSLGDDGVTWTFKLDPDGMYSDGRPVVAEDFVFAFARTADPDFAAVSAYQGQPIAGWADVNGAEPSGAIGDVPVSGVVAVDDHTLTVTTDEPFALLPKLLTYPVFAPVPADFVATEESAAAFADQPIGNGPYMMAEPWQHNEGITVVRNPNYAGTQGRADTIEFRIYGDAATAYKDFEAGDLDIARNVPPESIGPARDAYPDTFVVTHAAQLGYIGFPGNVAPFDNPDIRLAFSLAIDREAIAERVYEGTASPATGMVPSQAPGALEGVCDACTYDPERAKELFDGAGGVPGNSIVVYNISDDGTASLDPILNSWREVFGIEIEVRSFEFGQYLEETAAGKPVGPFELGWVWDYPSGYSFLSPLFESTSGVNNFGFADAAFDEQMRLTREAADETSGLPFLAEGQRIVEAAMPLAPVTFSADVGVHSTRLTNVVIDAGALWRLELVAPAS